jgi:hypothetical protein
MDGQALFLEGLLVLQKLVLQKGVLSALRRAEWPLIPKRFVGRCPIHAAVGPLANGSANPPLAPAPSKPTPISR